MFPRFLRGAFAASRGGCRAGHKWLPTAPAPSRGPRPPYTFPRDSGGRLPPPCRAGTREVPSSFKGRPGHPGGGRGGEGSRPTTPGAGTGVGPGPIPSPCPPPGAAAVPGAPCLRRGWPCRGHGGERRRNGKGQSGRVLGQGDPPARPLRLFLAGGAAFWRCKSG